MSATNVSRIGTVVVPVADQDRALDFYVGTLGFETRMDAPIGGGMRWIEVAPRGAATTIALVASAGGGAGGVEISLATTDAQADHARILASGVEADAALIEMGEGVPPMFTFRDPDGNPFRVVQRD
ncbi:MAG TPA: VOC family protein [Solirubrobacteraceae bacterium]|jgi:catechol 2,3-dioxygenase-like lactoylglutathione lyase family enzyme|nr:VOC family protein [Solirubrobacteraceae bacterium]